MTGKYYLIKQEEDRYYIVYSIDRKEGVVIENYGVKWIQTSDNWYSMKSPVKGISIHLSLKSPKEITDQQEIRRLNKIRLLEDL